MPTMRAVTGTSLSEDGYAIEEQELPEPGAGQVRIRVKATALSHADALVAFGRYQVRPQVPFVPGSEFSGVIDALGDEGTGSWQVGDRVSGRAFGGTLAEYAVVGTGQIRRLADGVDFVAGARSRVDYATALLALKDRAALRAGEAVLVLGAAGGVGMAAVQLARHMGAFVIGAASTEAKRAAVLAAGADAAIDYRQEGWRDELRRVLGERPLGVVFDPVGGEAFEPAFRSLGWGGRHLVIGFASGTIGRLPANLPLLKGAALVGVDVRQFGIFEPAAASANEIVLDELLDSGAIRPLPGPTFAFADFTAALTAAADGSGSGRVVVEIGNG